MQPGESKILDYKKIMLIIKQLNAYIMQLSRLKSNKD